MSLVLTENLGYITLAQKYLWRPKLWRLRRRIASQFKKASVTIPGGDSGAELVVDPRLSILLDFRDGVASLGGSFRLMGFLFLLEFSSGGLISPSLTISAIRSSMLRFWILLG